MMSFDSLTTVSTIFANKFPNSNEIIQVGEPLREQWLSLVEDVETRIILADAMLGGEWRNLRMPKMSADSSQSITLEDLDRSVAWLDEFIVSIASKRPARIPEFNFRAIMPAITRFKSELLSNPSLSLFYRRISSGLRDNTRVNLPLFITIPSESSLRLEWYKVYTAHGELTESADFQSGLTSALNFEASWTESDDNLLLLLLAYIIKSQKTSGEGFQAIKKKLDRLSFNKPSLINISKAMSVMGET